MKAKRGASARQSNANSLKFFSGWEERGKYKPLPSEEISFQRGGTGKRVDALFDCGGRSRIRKGE